MEKSIIILVLMTVWLYSCGQRSASTGSKTTVESEITDSIINDHNQLAAIQDIHKYIYSDTTYTSSTGKGITIQNSFPKGGSIEPNGTQYIDVTGKKHGFVVFWTRIINETIAPLELKIDFPADSFAIFSPPGSYLKLFLPTDIMTFDKLSSYNYGLTGIKPFLDTNFNRTTMLQRTINPNEEYLFYVTALSYRAGGTARAGMILKEEDLYYNISIAPQGSALIPCGKINKGP